MKKITAPSQEKPEVYRQMSVVESNNKSDVETVPPKNIFNYNLKKIKSFKQIRRKYKLSNQEKVFVQDLSLLLREYKPEEYQFDKDLLINVLNIAESFFIYGSKEEREEIKNRAVCTLLKPYFRDDVEIYEMMVSSVWHKVKKSNLLKRILKRTANFF